MKKMVQDFHKLVYWISNRQLPVNIAPQDREDAVQEAFMALIKVTSYADTEKNIQALVNLRIRGALKDFMKQKSKISRLNQRLRHEKLQQEEERTMESQITKKDLSLQTRIMMYGLRDKERQAIEKYYLEGKNVREIAEDLAISTTTAWRLIREGVSELRESMAEYHTEGVNWKC